MRPREFRIQEYTQKAFTKSLFITTDARSVTRSSLLIRIVRWTLRHPKTTLWLAGLVTALALFSAQNLKLRSNFSDLLPDTHPVVVQARILNDVVGGASFVVAAIESSDRDAAIAFMDDLHRQAITLEGIRYIDSRPPQDFYQRYALLYLDLADLEKIHERVQRKIEQTKLARTGFFIDLEDEESKSQFSLSEFREKYTPYLNPDPYYQNPAGTLFVTLIKPEWRTTDVDKTALFLEKLQGTIDALNPAGYHSSLRVRLTGPYVKTLAQQHILKRDASRVTCLALIGSIIYLIFHFRRKRAVFLIAVPLLMSVSWTLAFASLFFGSLNLFSSVACAIVIGLAADYGIHLYSDYLRYRQRGAGAEPALLAAVQHLRPAFMIAATTTAAAFFALALSEFKAFSELGLIAGAGILCCALAFLILLPPLVLLLERHRPEDLEERPARTFERFAFGRFGTWIVSRRAGVVVGLVLLLPVITIAMGQLFFDYNTDHIMGTQPTKALDSKVDAIFSQTVNPEIALVEVAADAPRLAAALRSLKQQPEHGESTIKDVIVLDDFIPRQQEAKRVKIAAIRGLLSDDVVDRLSADDRRSYEQFKAMLQPPPLTRADLPAQIRDKFRDLTGEEGRIVFIFPNFPINESDTLIRYAEEIRQVHCADCVGTYYLAGESTVFYEIIQMLFHEGQYVMGAALVAVFLLLWLNFRSLQQALLVLMPLGVTLLSLLSWMGLLGIPLNIINLAAFPIVLGAVTDYVVHFYQRYRDDPAGTVTQAYAASLSPIVGSAVTTLIGFAALLTANMGGLRSMGLVTALGIGLGLITTLLWFPGLLSFFHARWPAGSHALQDPDRSALGDAKAT